MRAKKRLAVKWQRLFWEGQTCPRCGSTESEIEKAVVSLTQALAPLGFEVVLAKQGLSAEEFKQDLLQSNRIWINDRLLEDWLGAAAGQSVCCEVCVPAGCRTLAIGEKTYETIPARLIVRAGLLAAAQPLDQDACGC